MVLGSNKRRRSGGVRHSHNRQNKASIWQRHPEYTLLVCFALCLSLAISMVALPASSAEKGYQIVASQQELARLEREAARLKLEVSRLESLERIEQAARFELGMVDAQEVRMVTVDTPHLQAEVQPGDIASQTLTQRFTTGLVTFVARAVAGRPAQAGN